MRDGLSQSTVMSVLQDSQGYLWLATESGLDRYERPDQLLTIFERMQRFQMECAADPNRPGYRRNRYSDPGTPAFAVKTRLDALSAAPFLKDLAFRWHAGHR